MNAALNQTSPGCELVVAGGGAAANLNQTHESKQPVKTILNSNRLQPDTRSTCARTGVARSAGRRTLAREVNDPTLSSSAVSDASPSATSAPADTAASRESTCGGDAYRLYLREIGPIKLLTPDEEIEVARRVQQGDPAARELMIKSNLKLVVKIAHDFDGCGLPLLDLIEEGNMGLMKAVERFDPDRGTRLACYAAYWIKQYMRRAISNHGRTIRLPVHVHEKLWHLTRATKQLQELLGRAPTDEELGQEIKISPAKVNRLREAGLSSVSLDAALGDDDSEEVGAIIPDERAARPDEQLDTDHWRGLLETSLARLNPRELAVLKCRFGLGGDDDHTLEEVGAQLGLTRERIRQIQNVALRKLRACMESKDAMQVAA